jgi:hypothetical protein
MITTINTELKKRIMRRVYVAWFMREMLPKLTLQVLTLGLVLSAIHEFVATKSVFGNAWTALKAGVPSFAAYLTVAVGHTDTLAQILTVASLMLLGLLARDAVKATRRMKGSPALVANTI